MELSNVVSATVSSFIEYALIIVTIMIIWYVFKFFMVAPPTKEEKEAALQAQREAWGGAIKKGKEKYEERKKEGEKKKEQGRKRNLASPAKLDIRKTIEVAEKAMLHLDNTDLPKLRKAVKDLHGEMHDLWTHLRMLRGKVEREERQKVEQMIAEVQALRQVLGEKIKDQLPDQVGDATTWHNRMKPLRQALGTIQQGAGAVFNKLEEFYQ